MPTLMIIFHAFSSSDSSDFTKRFAEASSLSLSSLEKAGFVVMDCVTSSICCIRSEDAI